jgi:hypothetical protein
MKLLVPIAVRQTKMRRAQMTISTPEATQMLQKSLTANMILVVVVTTTLMRMTMISIWMWMKKTSRS